VAALPGPAATEPPRTATEPPRTLATAPAPEPFVSRAAPPAAPAPSGPAPQADPALTGTSAAPPPLARVPTPPQGERAVPSTTSAPTDCLPASLRGVLADVASRFQGLTLISTTQLHSDNHSAGSARHSMHGACRAVDFKTASPVADVTAYLHTRKELAGINSYRNGVIHIDVNAGATASATASAAAATAPPAPRRTGRPLQLQRPRPAAEARDDQGNPPQ
jgi:hypothetical protein